MRFSFALKASGDVIFVHIAYILAFLIRFGGVLPEYNWEAYLNTAPYITLAIWGLFYSYGLYSNERLRWDERFAGVATAVIVLFFASISLSYMLTQFAFPRLVFLIAAPLQLLLLGGWRRFIWYYSKSRSEALRVAVVGPLVPALNRATQLKHNSDGMFEIKGIVTDDTALPDIKMAEGFKILAAYSDAAVILDKVKVDSLLFCADVPPGVRVDLALQAEAKGVTTYLIPDMYDILISQSKFEQLDGIPVFRVTGRDYDPTFLWKRLTDIALTILVGLPAVPMLVLAVLAIKLESPRAEVFFRQQRVGRNGRTFELLKLRTMVPDAEKLTGPILAEREDPRITKVGGILRLLRVDELPQLLNVLKGEMSFVGPRPERPFFVEQFCREIEGYAHRHNINVGITGLAQVAGKYDTPAEDKLRYDLVYAKTKSPVKDLVILLQTMKTLLTRGKAM